MVTSFVISTIVLLVATLFSGMIYVGTQFLLHKGINCIYSSPLAYIWREKKVLFHVMANVSDTKAMIFAHSLDECIPIKIDACEVAANYVHTNPIQILVLDKLYIFSQVKDAIIKSMIYGSLIFATVVNRRPISLLMFSIIAWLIDSETSIRELNVVYDLKFHNIWLNVVYVVMVTVQNFIEALSALLYLMQMIFPYVFLVISHGRIVDKLRRYNMWSLNNLTIREMIKVEVKFRNARIPPSLQYFLENLKKHDITHQFDDITICTLG
jgi:hypothetical protein